MEKNLETYLGYGTLGGGMVAAGVGLQRKSVPVAIAGLSCAVLGAFLLAGRVQADPGNGNGNGTEVSAFAMTKG